MKISDLLDVRKLEQHIADGNVSVKTNDLEYWTIYNYTPKVQFDHLWDDVLILTRGLVIHTEDQEVLARPFPKFFNLAELTKPPEGAYRVFDKLDGSLGIGIFPGHIATRGSFESDQAKAAMQIWKEKYSHVVWPEGYTPLWEIIHPTSRVVVEYGFEDLCLLCMIHIETGMCFYPKDSSYCDWWPGPVVREFDDIDYTNPPIRSNAEGFVVVFEDGTRVKIKYDEYVQLHKIVTGLSEKTILEEYCMKGKSLDDLKDLPDELHKWAIDTALDFFKRYDDISISVASLFGSRPKFESRRDFAFWASQFPKYASMLFSLLDGKPITDLIWKYIKQESKNDVKNNS